MHGRRISVGPYLFCLLLSGTARAQLTFVENEQAKASPGLLQTVAAKGLDASLKKSAGNLDSAQCLVSIWYNGDGVIQAAQIIHSSGVTHIDHACLATLIGQTVIPPSLVFPERGGWASIPISWNFTTKPPNPLPSPPPIRVDFGVPTLRQGAVPNLSTVFYPAAALAERRHGICQIHVSVSAEGDVDALDVTQSTGSPDLDQACRDALYGSTFVPALREGKPIAATTDIVFDWRLPKTENGSAISYRRQ